MDAFMETYAQKNPKAKPVSAKFEESTVVYATVMSAKSQDAEQGGAGGKALSLSVSVQMIDKTAVDAVSSFVTSVFTGRNSRNWKEERTAEVADDAFEATQPTRGEQYGRCS